MDWNKKRRGELREGGKISRRDKGRGTRNDGWKDERSEEQDMSWEKRGKGGLDLKGAPS